MACNKAINFILSWCAEAFTIDVGLEAATDYFVCIKSMKTERVYQGRLTTNNDGKLIVYVADFPANLFNPYSGTFELSIRGGINYLEVQDIVLNGETFQKVFFRIAQIENPQEENSLISQSTAQ